MSSSNLQSYSTGPVSDPNRIETLDTLRGVALLGILPMNIVAMALPFAAYFSPNIYGGTDGIHFGSWAFTHLFFEMKMMGIFSMLFGAGLMLMMQRAKNANSPFGRIYFRRIFWLLVIGLFHGYLLWHGDILVTYAICGAIIFLFRNRTPKTLFISGIVVLLIGMLILTGGGFSLQQLRKVTIEIEEKVSNGEEMTPRRQALIDQWNEVHGSFHPTIQESKILIEKMQGDFSTVLKENIKEASNMHIQALPFVLLWRALGLMLLGMGLMKIGFFSGEKSKSSYKKWCIYGLVIGIPLTVYGVFQWQSHNFDFVAGFTFDGHFNYVGSIFLSMAYVSGVILICISGKLVALRKRLAAVGRMALTNYLLQSIIGIFIFYGYGLALFGQIYRFHLWWFIIGIWCIQLIVSQWWLKRFQFGPLEWLWRTATYWKKQPFQKIQ